MVVFYGYFDDSGTDGDSQVAIMAGYVAHVADWKKFERKTKQLFAQEGIEPFFRAKLFDHARSSSGGGVKKGSCSFMLDQHLSGTTT
jgi:hypothetical protein